MRRRVAFGLAFGLAFGRTLRGGLSPLSLTLLASLVVTGVAIAHAAGVVDPAWLALGALAVALSWIAAYAPVHRALVMPRWRRRAKRLGDVRAFQLALAGHAVLVLAVGDGAWGVIAGWRGDRPALLVASMLLLLGGLAALARWSPGSPWSCGPALIAAPHGVQVRGYRVPWTGIESVGLSSNGVHGAWIRTRATLGAYARHRSARQRVVAGRTLHVAPFGASPEALRAYLETRRELECRRATARAANERATRT